MTRHRMVVWVAGLLCGGLALGLASPVAAGELGGSRDARAAAMAAALEAANLRAKAKIELARILDREGRTQEAVAALLEADRILAEAPRLAAEVAIPLTPGTTAPPTTPVPPSIPGPGGVVRITPRVGSGRPPASRPPPVVPTQRAAPRSDPTAAAVRWLLGRQGPDGSFPAALGEGGSDAADLSATAWALLALAEVATGDGLDRSAGPLADRASAAAARAAGFLLWSAKDDGSMAPTLHDHCVAAWAVSSAFSRLGLRLVSEMPKQFGLTREMVEHKVVAAVRHALSAQDPVTGRLSVEGGPDEEALAALAFGGFLHEVEPLPLAKGFATSIETARAKVLAAAAIARPGETPPQGSVGIVARSLLRGHRIGIAELFTAHAAVDPLALLYGTVSVSSHGTEADGETWWQDVLVPAMNTQVVVGKDAGSFPPAGARLGRTHATAIALLTWLYPEMEWRAPAED